MHAVRMQILFLCASHIPFQLVLDNGDISKTLDALLEATPNDNPELLEFTRQSVNVDWSVLEDADQGREKDQGSGQGPLPVKS